MNRKEKRKVGKKVSSGSKKKKKKKNKKKIRIGKKSKKKELLMEIPDLEILRVGDDFSGRGYVDFRSLQLGRCRISIEFDGTYKCGDNEVMKKFASKLYDAVSISIHLTEEDRVDA